MPAVEATHRPSARPAAPPTGLVATAMRAAHTASGEGAGGGLMGRAMRQSGSGTGAGVGTPNAAWPRYLTRCAGHGSETASHRSHTAPGATGAGSAWGGVPAGAAWGSTDGAVDGSAGGGFGGPGIGMFGIGGGSAGGGGMGGAPAGSGLWGLLRSGAGAVGDLIGRGLGVLSGPLRALLPALPPMLLPWLSPGPAPWLAQRISEGLHALGAPLRALNPMGAIQAMLGTAGRWAQRVSEGVGALAAGGCASVMDSVVNLPALLRRLAGGVGGEVQRLLQPIGQFMDRVWRSSVAPLTGWMAQQAGGVWGFIRDTGQRLWQGTAGLRAVPGQLWTFVSQQLFRGHSAVGWLTERAEGVWQHLRGGLGRVWGAVSGAATRVGELAGPGGLGRLWNGAMAGALGMAQAAAAPLGRVMHRVGSALQHGVGLALQPGGIAAMVSGLLPQLDSVSGLLDSGRHWLSAKVGALGAAAGSALAALRSNPFTAPLAAGLETLGHGVGRVMHWGQGVAAQGLRGLQRSLGFLRPVFNAVRSVGRRAAGLLPRLWGGARGGIAHLVDAVTQSAQLMGSAAWQAIPCCIRDPLARVLNRLIGQAVFQIAQPPGVHGGGVVGRGMGGVLGGVLNVPPRWMRSVLQPWIAAASRGASRGGIMGGLGPNGIAEILRRITPNPHGPHRSAPHISDTTPCSRHVMAAMVQRLAEEASTGAAGGITETTQAAVAGQHAIGMAESMHG